MAEAFAAAPLVAVDTVLELTNLSRPLTFT